MGSGILESSSTTAASGMLIGGQIACGAVVGAIGGAVDEKISKKEEAKVEDYLKGAIVGGIVGGVAGYLGGPGATTKHMSSSIKSLFRTGNMRYYISQTAKVTKIATRNVVKSIFKGTIPSICKLIIEKKM